MVREDQSRTVLSRVSVQYPGSHSGDHLIRPRFADTLTQRVGPFFILPIACFASLAAFAQDQTPTFRTTTRMVELSVVALTRDGQAVVDLRKDEIEIFEKGKRREVAFFRFDGEPEARLSGAALPAGIFTNRVEFTGGPPRNITALVLDTLNTDPRHQMWARAQLLRYLKALAPKTRVAVYHLGSTLRVLHDFTGDADALRARLETSGLQLPAQTPENIDNSIREAEQLIRMFPEDPYLAEMLTAKIETEMLYNAQVRQRKVETTLAAMDTLGAHLAGIPGRKNLVWIGGGISMFVLTGAMGFGPRASIQSHETAVRSASQRLAQHNIALYVVDARGLTGPQEAASADVSGAPVIRGRGRFERQQQAEQTSADPLPAAYTMAGITGGRVIINTNDPAEGLKLAEQDVRGAYALGFYAGSEPDGKWHDLKVRSKRPGVRLVHRQGYIAETGESALAEWTTAEWRSAVANPLGSTAIAIDARCQPPPGGDPATLAIILQLEPRHLLFRRQGEHMVADVEIAVAEKLLSGETNFYHEPGQFRLRPEQYASLTPANLRYARTWKPAPGISTVRILVRDRLTGRYGTLDLPAARIPTGAGGN